MLGHAVVGQVKGLAKERLTLATTGLSSCLTMVIWHCGDQFAAQEYPIPHHIDIQVLDDVFGFQDCH